MCPDTCHVNHAAFAAGLAPVKGRAGKFAKPSESRTETWQQKRKGKQSLAQRLRGSEIKMAGV